MATPSTPPGDEAWNEALAGRADAPAEAVALREAIREDLRGATPPPLARLHARLEHEGLLVPPRMRRVARARWFALAASLGAVALAGLWMLTPPASPVDDEVVYRGLGRLVLVEADRPGEEADAAAARLAGAGCAIRPRDAGATLLLVDADAACALAVGELIGEDVPAGRYRLAFRARP